MNVNGAPVQMQLDAWVMAAQQLGVPPQVVQEALLSCVAAAVYRDAMMAAIAMNPFFQQAAWSAAQGAGGWAQPGFDADPILQAELASMRIAARSCRGRLGPMPRASAGEIDLPRAPTSQGGAPSTRMPTAQGVAPIRSTPLPTGPADTRLAALQSSTVDFAQRELDRGITLAKNPDRVAEYARSGGMPGGHWCGYFTGFNYQQAAQAAGGEFNKDAIHKFHSMQKARAYFEYSNYTKGTNDDALRTQHEAQGSTRRWMVLEGSHGQQHAQTNGRPAEVYSSPRDLPIRKGDTVLFSFGHVGIVKDYDPTTGKLTTIEGNAGGGKVKELVRDLDDPKMRAQIEGFGRPAMGDFKVAA